MIRQVYQNKQTGQLLVTIPKTNDENIVGNDFVTIQKVKAKRCQKCGKIKNGTLCIRCDS